jgi:TonB-linked SusC/RagA family outer membrane protein
MKRKLLLFICAFFVSISIYAQERNVTGIVSDAATGEPLPGVNVVLKGTTIGTTTGVDGDFSLNVPDESTILIFSFIGYIDEAIVAGDRSVINVALMPDIMSLEEFVVVGYGTQKKVNLTGSVVTVDGDELSAKPVMTASMALQGVASGVTVTQSSGKPGGDGGTIRIRGIGTLGNSNPLVLIDGVEGDLNGVDANDIESISVLKDAASAAIYGSRAANGVILIATKRANQGDVKVNYKSYVGWQEFTGLPKYVSGYDYMIKNNEAMINAGKTPVWTDDYIQQYQSNSGLYSKEYPDVSWQDLFYSGSGLQQHHNVNVSGGGEKLHSMLSLSLMDQQGIIPGFNYKRYSVRLNNDYKVSDKIQFKLDVNGRFAPAQEPSQGEANISENVQRLPALMAVYTPEGKYSTNFMNYGNPLALLLDAGNRFSDSYNITSRFVANIQPIDGMDIEFAYSPNINMSFAKSNATPVAMYESDDSAPVMFTPSKSSLFESYSKSWTNTLHGLISYNKSLGSHNLSGLAGYEQIDYKTNWLNAYRENFAFLDYMEMSNGSVINMNNGGSASEWSLRSFFSRLNYNFQEKYLLEANVRYDGSSRFATGNKHGLFPSFSAGWRVSEEGFMSGIEWMDNLKLSASWGQLGNQNIGTYPFASVVNLGLNYVFNDAPVPGAALTEMANEKISWETTTTTNIGLDFGIFNNKLSGTFEYYIRNTDDILLRLPVPTTIGLSAPYQNAGKVKNVGWDFNLNYKNYDNTFKYSVGFILSDVQNEVVDLKESGPYIGGFTITREGDPIGALYMLESDGFFQSQEEIDNHATQFGTLAPGDIKYVDQLTVDTDGDGIPDAADGKIDADDRVLVGSNIPRYSFGVNLEAQYKGFDALLFLQGVGKRQTYFDQYVGWAFYNLGNIQEYQMDSWSPDNTDATQPRVIDGSSHNNFNSSDFWMYNAAYFRIKTVQLGYTIPSNVVRTLGVDKLRLYFAANNLFTSHSLPDGWDPEQPMGQSATYPITSSYVFGLELNF